MLEVTGKPNQSQSNGRRGATATARALQQTSTPVAVPDRGDQYPHADNSRWSDNRRPVLLRAAATSRSAAGAFGTPGMADFQSRFCQSLATPNLSVNRNRFQFSEITSGRITFTLQGWTPKGLFVYYVFPASGRLTNQNSRQG